MFQPSGGINSRFSLDSSGKSGEENRTLVHLRQLRVNFNYCSRDIESTVSNATSAQLNSVDKEKGETGPRDVAVCRSRLLFTAQSNMSAFVGPSAIMTLGKALPNAWRDARWSGDHIIFRHHHSLATPPDGSEAAVIFRRFTALISSSVPSTRNYH